MPLTYNPTQTSSEESLTDGRRLHFYEKGEEIPLASEGVWQVYRGIAQLGQLSENGEEVLLGWVQTSAFFGAWLTHLDAYQVKALSDLYLRWYSLEQITSSPKLSQLVLTQIVCRQRQTEALLAICGLRKVEDRLQALLKLLEREFGEPSPQGTRIKVRLTHQNLAAAINTTRVTITRLLGEFQRQGIVSFDRERHLIIP